jgi:U3 small nucleolar RNA-associated protein 10
MFQHFEDFKAQQNELSEFFLKALEFRCDQESEAIDEEEGITVVFGDVNEAEGFVIKAFVALVLKLSESSFRPLYFSLYDWAIRNSDSKEKLITFYRLSDGIAEALKSLFVLFASDVILNAAEVLDKLNIGKVEGAANLYFPDDPEKNLYLMEQILKTLYNIFLHDRQNFINPHRFDVLMQPIVDQLENEMLLENQALRTLLINCLGQLAVAASDDILWKQMNYQILLKARNNNSEVRIFSLNACLEVARKLGEEFQPLLPETIPFLAELLEDENYKVEEACQKTVQELEKILGEPLQKYF